MPTIRLLRGDRVQFKSQGYKDVWFYATVLRVYRIEPNEVRTWRVLVDDGLGNLRVVSFDRIRHQA